MPNFENIVRKIHEAGSRQSHLQSPQSGFSFFSLWNIHSVTSGTSADRFFPPLILASLSPSSSNPSITPFLMPLSLYLPSHFSSVHPHIHFSQGSRCACVGERADTYTTMLCAVRLTDSRGSWFTLLCLNETQRKRLGQERRRGVLHIYNCALSIEYVLVSRVLHCRATIQAS